MPVGTLFAHHPLAAAVKNATSYDASGWGVGAHALTVASCSSHGPSLACSTEGASTVVVCQPLCVAQHTVLRSFLEQNIHI